MEFSEKLLTLRKAKTLTQEELAEKLNVSRQSVSKWESGQAVPELDKIVAISTVFDVTTDYLLKSSEIDDLSVKTEMLEKQQEQMLAREKRQQKIRGSGDWCLQGFLRCRFPWRCRLWLFMRLLSCCPRWRHRSVFPRWHW